MAHRKSHPARQGRCQPLLLALAVPLATAATPADRPAPANGRPLLEYSLRAHDASNSVSATSPTNAIYQPNVRNTGPVEFLQPGRQLLLNLTLQF